MSICRTRKRIKGGITMETVTIPKDEYERLMHNSEFLGCLEGAGVDNWEGYDFAIDMMKEDEE